MIAGKIRNPGKPLASKGQSKLGPVCFVDATSRVSGPHLNEMSRVVIEAVRRIKEERALDACAVSLSSLHTRHAVVRKPTEPPTKRYYPNTILLQPECKTQ